MDNNYLVSIITVCYNSEKTIRDTIESVLNQTYDNYEYIVIDGGSTDKTLSIINEYKEIFKEKIKIVSEKDNGIYDAMNKGIEIASGYLIGFVNSDDWYESDAIESMVSSYNGKKHEILYGMLREYSNGREIGCWLKHHEFLKHQMITFPTCFITKSTYDDFGGYDFRYKASADYDFMLRMMKKNVEFLPIYKVISNFRHGGMSGQNIGRIETGKIRYKYGVISKSQLIKILVNQQMRVLVKKVLKKFGLRK